MSRQLFGRNFGISLIRNARNRIGAAIHDGEAADSGGFAFSPVNVTHTLSLAAVASVGRVNFASHKKALRQPLGGHQCSPIPPLFDEIYIL